MGKKITFIGAGSVVFTQGLLYDMIRTFNGEKWSLSLVDIDSSALNIAYRLSKKMIEQLHSDIILTASIDRAELLPGSDYVVTMIGVGGRRAWERDVFIPREFGVFQPVGDTVMPGGISRAMRMIPQMVAIAHDVERLAPNARFFNFANPMTSIVRALYKASSVEAVGLCHGHQNTLNAINFHLKLDAAKTKTLALGLNHFSFIHDLRNNGRDVFPELIQSLEQLLLHAKEIPTIDEENDRAVLFTTEFARQYGVFPVPSDRHITEFFGERFSKKNAYFGYTLGLDAFSFENTIREGDSSFEYMTKCALSDDPLSSSHLNELSGEHEQLMSIIRSMENNERSFYYANLPHNGMYPELPEYAVLEMPVLASARGVLPVKVPPLSPELYDILKKHIAIAELTVEGALKGDRGLFCEAVYKSGCMETMTAAQELVDKLIEAQKEFLPRFFP